MCLFLQSKQLREEYLPQKDYLPYLRFLLSKADAFEIKDITGAALQALKLIKQFQECCCIAEHSRVVVMGKDMRFGQWSFPTDHPEKPPIMPTGKHLVFLAACQQQSGLHIGQGVMEIGSDIF